MARKQKKYHYIYKTTNLLNEKYYYGMHSTNDLEDGYYGSGKRLRYSINKYGKENHKVEILEYLNSRKELSEREKEIINLNEIAKEDCINLMVGGYGGFVSDEHKEKFIESSKKTRFTSNNNPSYYKDKKVLSEFFKKLNSEGKIPRGSGFKDRKHSNESIIKMRESMKGKSSGEKNSQYGTCWITNGMENKKMNKNNKLPDGWNLGRKIKK